MNDVDRFCASDIGRESTAVRVGRSPLLEQWDVNELRYSFVWEDIQLLLQAYDEMRGGIPKPQARILSISSSGDNALGMLLTDPIEIIALDLSPAQHALANLKRHAVKVFCCAEFGKFHGEDSTQEERLALFEKLVPSLDENVAAFWVARKTMIAEGLHSSGRLDRYFKKFRDLAIPQLWSRNDFENMVQARDLATQNKYWQKVHQQNLQNLSMGFFNQSSLSSEGRHASQFAYVHQPETGATFLKAFMRLTQRSLISENPYLYHFLTGMQLKGPHALPLFSIDTYELIRARIDRLTFHCCDLESYLSTTGAGFDFMNLSDIFEYLNEVQTAALFEALSRRLNRGGTLAYWTLLVNRRPDEQVLARNVELSTEFSGRDRTWFYSGFHLTQSTK